MKTNRSLKRLLFRFCALVVCAFPTGVPAGDIPAAGSLLPDIQLQGPASEKERNYLGIGDADTFPLERIQCQLMLIEIVGVYCPQCHRLAPHFNRLFHRIRKDPTLGSRMKMFSVAAGANPTEVAYMKKEFRIPFPVLVDPEFQAHKLLGEPRTPFTLLVRKDRTVLSAHTGPIEDFDRFFLQIKRFAR